MLNHNNHNGAVQSINQQSMIINRMIVTYNPNNVETVCV